MITAFSDNYLVGHLTEPWNRAYAEAHGYDFVSDILSVDVMNTAVGMRSLQWYKVVMILRCLEEAKTRGYSHIVWIDADAVVLDPKSPLSLFLTDPADSNWVPDLIIAEDMTLASMLNTGVMIVRVSEWSRNLWKDVWTSGRSKRFHVKLFHEQSSLCSILQYRKEEGLQVYYPFRHSFSGGEKIKKTKHVLILNRDALNFNFGGWSFLEEKESSNLDPPLSDVEGHPESSQKLPFAFHAVGVHKVSAVLKALRVYNRYEPSSELLSRLEKEVILQKHLVNIMISCVSECALVCFIGVRNKTGY